MNRAPNLNLVNSIKASGVERALFDAVNGRLWAVRQALDHAATDRFKEFPSAVVAARKALDEAETLYQEWSDCPRVRQGKRKPAEVQK